MNGAGAGVSIYVIGHLGVEARALWLKLCVCIEHGTGVSLCGGPAYREVADLYEYEREHGARRSSSGQ